MKGKNQNYIIRFDQYISIVHKRVKTRNNIQYVLNTVILIFTEHQTQVRNSHRYNQYTFMFNNAENNKNSFIFKMFTINTNDK